MKKKILRIDDVTLTSNEKSQIFGGAKEDKLYKIDILEAYASINN